MFDNISRGAALTCPVIEKALTAAEMEDRVLKETRNERVACTAPMAFTGNNITPKGDLASRSLMTRIVVDRPDPENRTFVHPDPFQWTLDHRGEILEALYTILSGNPRLYDRRKDEKTRFKLWQRMVGAAIEHAAELAGQGVDFAQLFSDAEGDDEETSSLAEAMECLDRLAKGKPFKSADVLQWTTSEDDDARILKAFLGGGGRRRADDEGRHSQAESVGRRADPGRRRRRLDAARDQAVTCAPDPVRDEEGEARELRELRGRPCSWCK